LTTPAAGKFTTLTALNGIGGGTFWEFAKQQLMI
jgi:hypothetical protein